MSKNVLLATKFSANSIYDFLKDQMIFNKVKNLLLSPKNSCFFKKRSI